MIAESAATGNGEARPFYSFLESCLRHKTEMVIFEAARAICAMRDVSTRELAPAVTVLQLFLSSSKPVLRFAAVRTLNKARAAVPGNVLHLLPKACAELLDIPWRPCNVPEMRLGALAWSALALHACTGALAAQLCREAKVAATRRWR